MLAAVADFLLSSKLLVIHDTRKFPETALIVLGGSVDTLTKLNNAE